MVTFTLPVLVRVTLCWPLDPTVTELKLMLVGLMLSWGFAAETPLAERGIVRGDVGASLTSVKVPAALPPD